MGSAASVYCAPAPCTSIQSRKRVFDVAATGSSCFKVLILGPASAGKSTILKQVKIALGDGFSLEELTKVRGQIFNNIISSMNLLTKYIKDFNGIYESNERLLDADLANNVEVRGDAQKAITPELTKALTDLWNDQSIKAALKEHGDSIHMPTNAEYFFEELARVGGHNYIPSYQDVLECRTTTPGECPQEIVYSGLTFSVTDMSGRRHVRKKWKQHFDEAQGIIYVVALSEYDQYLEEDETVNRMHDALSAFSDVVNSPALRDTPIIILFNKIDVFRKKIQHIPLTEAFKEYEGDQEWEPALEFIQEEFMKQVHGNARSLKRKGTVFGFYTLATSTPKMKEVVEAVFDIVKTKVFYSVY